MSQPTKAAGYSSRIVIENVPYGVRNFRVERRVDEVECGDTEDGRYKRHKATRKSATVSFTIIIDPFLLPAATVGIFEGAYVEIVYYPFGIDGDSYQLSDVLIQSVGESQDINGLIEESISGVTNGEYILPGENEART